MHHADRGRAADQRRQQVAARRDGVIDLAAGLCEQQAALEPVVDQRLGAEALGVGGPSGVARVVALPEGEQPRHHRGREQHAGAGKQRAQAADGPQLRAAFAVGLGHARIEERALGRVQRVGVTLRPVECGAEPGTAVEVRGSVPFGVPVARGVAEPPVQPKAFAILLQPAAQRRPLADQDLVRDLGRALVEREQPRVGEAVQQGADAVVR